MDRNDWNDLERREAAWAHADAEAAKATQHTPEPWAFDEESGVVHPDDDDLPICELMERSNPLQEIADGRRIVAAVNACAGIPTEALEAVGVGRAMLDLRKIVALIEAAKALRSAVVRFEDDAELDTAKERMDAALAAWGETACPNEEPVGVAELLRRKPLHQTLELLNAARSIEVVFAWDDGASLEEKAEAVKRLTKALAHFDDLEF